MDLGRYSRQIAFPAIGIHGQDQLAKSHVVVCGCGALGTAQANLMVRAGVGKLTIIDRDFVDLSNLQRQTLFDENDVQSHQPKAVAAATRLAEINSQCSIHPVVADLNWENIESLVGDADFVMDGTDNFETRFLINDVCCKTSKPWVFGGCLGAEGQSMTILPGTGACFACLMPEPPAADAVATCETGGILGPTIQMIASIQVTEALKVLTGQAQQVSKNLTVIDLWSSQFRTVRLEKLAERGCRVCRGHEFDWLEGRQGSHAKVLCGRNSVQLSGKSGNVLELDSLAERLKTLGQVLVNAYLLRFEIDEYAITVFPDSRTIVTGTEDPAVARSLVSKYIGA